MSKIARRDPDVCADGVTRQCIPIVPEVRRQQSFHRRPDAIDDRAQVTRRPLRYVLKVVERGLDRAATGMTEYDDEPRAESLRGEFDAAHLRGRDDVSGHADHEQIAQTLIENDLDGDP